MHYWINGSQPDQSGGACCRMPLFLYKGSDALCTAINRPPRPWRPALRDAGNAPCIFQGIRGVFRARREIQFPKTNVHSNRNNVGADRDAALVGTYGRVICRHVFALLIRFSRGEIPFMNPAEGYVLPGKS